MCGIFGVSNNSQAVELTVIGLHVIQHRAVDFAGITSTDGDNMYRQTGRGVARQVFQKDIVDSLHGRNALGHIRYSTVRDKESRRDNTQPIRGVHRGVEISIAHNGNLTNKSELEEFLGGRKLATLMDTECILRLIEARSHLPIDDALHEVFGLLKGSFTLGIMYGDYLIAARDPSGNRPLSIATLNGGYCISSETCAFDIVDATYLKDVDPGTMVTIGKGELRTQRFAEPRQKLCRFEHIYYGNPASNMFGEEISEFRLALGRALEKTCPVPGADIVVPVPDSATFIALGFAQSGRSGSYLPPILRNHYVGRTFNVATQAKRDEEVARKFIFARGLIAGKKIALIDDSIVRGTTLPKIVGKLYQLGAKEVHVRIGAPPMKFSCRYGIDTPTSEELVSSRMSVDELCKFAGAASLQFLPLEILRGLSLQPNDFCYACMDGAYW